MLATIRKRGNSQGLRFPKNILKEIDVAVNDDVNIEIKGQKIIVTKANTSEINLKKLFENYDKKHKPKEIDWGKPKGDEMW